MLYIWYTCVCFVCVCVLFLFCVCIKYDWWFIFSYRLRKFSRVSVCVELSRVFFDVLCIYMFVCVCLFCVCVYKIRLIHSRTDERSPSSKAVWKKKNKNTHIIIY